MKGYGSIGTHYYSKQDIVSSDEDVSNLVVTKDTFTHVHHANKDYRKCHWPSLLLTLGVGLAIMLAGLGWTTPHDISSPNNKYDFVEEKSWYQNILDGKSLLWQPRDLKKKKSHNNKKVVKLLQELDAQMVGDVLFPSDKDAFTDAWSVWNQAVTVPPLAVVAVATTDDVQLAVPLLVKIESNFGVPFSIKSGGHNYAGWSMVAHGIVLWTKHLNSFELVETNVEYAIASMGSGISDGALLKHGLVEHGYAGVCGSSGQVTMGGFLMGGGMGWFTRKHGLGLDNLVSVDIVLADGSLVTASDQQHADLFWALRGAGQAQFGVVTGYHYKLYPSDPNIMVAMLDPLPWSLGPHLLTKLAEKEPEMPDSVFVLVNNEPNGLTLSVTGAASPAELDAAQEWFHGFLADTLPLEIAHNMSYTRTDWYTSAMEEDAEFEGLMVNYWTGFLMQEDATHYDNWKHILQTMQDEFEDNPYVVVDIDIWGGGQVARVPPDATAFPWRNAFGTVGLFVFVPVDTKHADKVFEDVSKKVNHVWHSKLVDLLHGTYVNYAMKSLDTTGDVYATLAYNDNLERLKAIKAKYDPSNAFHSAIEIDAATTG